jgi:hypothetical protein
MAVLSGQEGVDGDGEKEVSRSDASGAQKRCGAVAFSIMSASPALVL